MGKRGGAFGVYIQHFCKLAILRILSRAKIRNKYLIGLTSRWTLRLRRQITLLLKYPLQCRRFIHGLYFSEQAELFFSRRWICVVRSGTLAKNLAINQSHKDEKDTDFSSTS